MTKKYKTWKDLCGTTMGYIGEFYGIEGIALISHGNYSDPELVYHEKSFNYYDVENAMVERYHEDTGDYSDNDEKFSKYMQDNAGEVFSILESLDEIGAYYEAPSFAYEI